MLLHKFRLTTSPEKKKKKKNFRALEPICRNQMAAQLVNHVSLNMAIFVFITPRLILFWNGLDDRNKAKCFMAMFGISRLCSEGNGVAAAENCEGHALRLLSFLSALSARVTFCATNNSEVMKCTPKKHHNPWGTLACLIHYCKQEALKKIPKR